jgi:hypothetical protein
MSEGWPPVGTPAVTTATNPSWYLTCLNPQCTLFRSRKQPSGEEYRYAPTLRWRDVGGETREGKLAEWRDAGDAEQLAAWVRSWAGFAPPAADTHAEERSTDPATRDGQA